MTVNNTFRILLIASLGVAVISCAEKRASDARISNFCINQQIKKLTASYKIPDDTIFGTDSKMYAEKRISIQWITNLGGSEPKALQDSVISTALQESISIGIDDAMLECAAKVEDFCGIPDSLAKPIESIPVDSNNVVYYYDVEARVVDLTEHVVVYKVYMETYAGGAHGYFANTYINYDVKNAKVLTFNDIFIPGSDSSVFEIVKNRLLNRYRVNTLQDLAEVSGIFVDGLYLTKNVFITPAGVSFYYNPYDIGPWSIGAITVHVPEYELTPYLTAAARSLFYQN